MNQQYSITRLCVRGMVAFACTAISANAVGPYTVDSDTLHLWHLDEVPGTLPALSTAEEVTGGIYDLNVTNGAKFATSDSGFGNALDTTGITGLELQAGAFADNGLYQLDSELSDPSTGAFTYEALIRPNFNPAVTNSRTAPMQIISFEDDGAETNRFFQFRLAAPTNDLSPWQLEFVNIGSFTEGNDGTASLVEVIDDFESGLSGWTCTRILDAGGSTTNTYHWQISVSNTLDLVTTAYDDIEQYAMIKDGVVLDVGEELRCDIPDHYGSQDIGLYVGGIVPVEDSRSTYVSVYVRDDGNIYSRGFGYTSEYGLVGAGVVPADKLFIARTSTTNYQAGYYVGSTRTVMVTRTDVFNDADNIGLYADVRATGTDGTVDNIEIWTVPSGVIPDVTTESFAVDLPTAGGNAAEAGSWYHVAATYNGNENTANNLKLYWTRRGQALNLLGQFQMVHDIANVATNLAGNFVVGNEGRGAPGENFNGYIDEVRISDIPRTSFGTISGTTPYSLPEPNTLALFHFNESTPGGFPTSLEQIAYDEVVTNPIDLQGSDDPGWGETAYNSSLNNAVGLSATQNRIGVGAMGASNFVNAATGAFTFEALIKPSWGGTNSPAIQEIICMEADGDASTRPFQFRIQSGIPVLRFDPIEIATTPDAFDANIPTDGVHAIVSDTWYHVAVAYDGNEAGSDNLNMYWTALNSGATEANVLATFTVTADLINPANTTGQFCIGNETRTSGVGGIGDEPFLGVIDEVRVSKVARSAGDFLFALSGGLDPFGITDISVSGGNVTLTWGSQSGATYSILRKTALTDGSWNTVKSAISSAGDGTTSDSVTASGSNEEFYQVEGN